ncbi:MAG: PD-(D/E)XK nuclease family protein [Candidatus Pacearchaeota archaeon]|nr:MAG: PD-(D/E)XK nuclease family protein [Candidatus Pacearchaeota archaeon]
MIDFDELIDEHIKREYKPKGIGRYYPSEAGSCLRKVWYSYKYPTEIAPELRKIFEMGNIIHDFIVQVLKSEKTPQVELLKSEFPFKEQIEDFTISGRIDNLIKVKISGKIYLVEIKSSAGIRFVKEASPHNVQQLQLYMHFIGVHNGLLVYIDKSTLKTKVFEINYDKEKAQKILERFKLLHKLLTTNTLPEPEARKHEKTKWMCRYCEYKDRCHKDTSRI